MRSIAGWVWKRGILSHFLSGLFAILPIAITVAIVSWVVGQLDALLGPDAAVGGKLRALGLHFVTDETTAWVIGWALVLVGIWLLGLLINSQTKNRLAEMFNGAVNRIPIIKGVYSTAVQVVGMLQKKEEKAELRAMNVVFCSFGEQQGGGFLALLASPDIYRFRDRDCHVIYIPTSPLPMSGGIIFVPTESVVKIEMSAEQLMQIYFSLGTLTSQVVPRNHQVPRVPQEVGGRIED